MKTNIIAKCIIFIIFIFIMTSFAFSGVRNNSNEAGYHTKVKKIEKIKMQKSDLGYATDKLIIPIRKLDKIISNQLLADIEIIIVLICLKNMLTLFTKLILLLSYYQFFLLCIIKRCFILASNFKIQSSIMRYLHLKDGKKSVLLFQFSY